MKVPPILPIAEYLTAIVVHQAENDRYDLFALLGELYPQVNVVAETDSADEVQKLLGAVHPDVLFLDGSDPEVEREGLIEQLQDEVPVIVLLRPDRQYDIRTPVFSLSGITDLSRLQRMLSYLTSSHSNGYQGLDKATFDEVLAELSLYLNRNRPLQRIVLSTEQGFILEEVNNIVRLQSDNNYVTVVRNGMKNVVLSKSLKDFEAVLDSNRFVRVHNSHIINIDYLKELESRGGGDAILRDGSRVPVSRRRHKVLIERIRQFICV